MIRISQFAKQTKRHIPYCEFFAALYHLLEKNNMQYITYYFDLQCEKEQLIRKYPTSYL